MQEQETQVQDENVPSNKIRIKKKYLLLGSLGILLLVVVGTGIFYFLSLEQPPSSETTQTETLSLPNQTMQLSEDELNLLKQINQEYSEEEYQEVYRNIIDHAENTEDIDISNCQINPIVYDLEGNILRFRNSTDEIHVISFSADETYDIEPKSTSEIPFEKDPGTYGYACNGSPNTSGLIVIR